MSQMSLFDHKRPSRPIGDSYQAIDPHQPKAFYSAAPGGTVVCHRCREKMRRDEVAAHTAVCWPECGSGRR